MGTTEGAPTGRFREGLATSLCGGRPVGERLSRGKDTLGLQGAKGRGARKESGSTGRSFMSMATDSKGLKARVRTVRVRGSPATALIWSSGVLASPTPPKVTMMDSVGTSIATKTQRYSWLPDLRFEGHAGLE